MCQSPTLGFLLPEIWRSALRISVENHIKVPMNLSNQIKPELMTWNLHLKQFQHLSKLTNHEVTSRIVRPLVLFSQVAREHPQWLRLYALPISNPHATATTYMLKKIWVWVGVSTRWNIMVSLLRPPHLFRFTKKTVAKVICIKVRG